MAFPVKGTKAKITSWGSSGDDVYQLINTAIRPIEMTLNHESDVQEITPLDAAATAKSYMGGLYSGTFDFTGLWPQTSPVLGNTGLLTLGSSYYAYQVESWFLNLNWGEEDITAFPAESAGTSGPSRRFMPGGLLAWDGGYTARTSSAAAISLPTTANGLGVTAAFKLKETGTNDASFTGNIVVKSASQPVAMGGGQIKVTYAFNGTGDLTSVAGDTGGPAILPAGVLAEPDWDNDGDGVPDVALVAQTYTGRTLSAKAFLRQIRIECNVGQPVKVTGTGRFSDGVTLA